MESVPARNTRSRTNSVIDLAGDDNCIVIDDNEDEEIDQAEPILVDLTNEPSIYSDDDVTPLETSFSADDDVIPLETCFSTNNSFQGVHGVIKAEKNISNDKYAETLKNQGNEMFRKGEFPNALNMYSQAISFNNKEATYFSNRSACYYRMYKFTEALNDGYTSVQCDQTYARGYERILHAALALGDVGRCDLIITQASSIQLGPEADRDTQSLRTLKEFLTVIKIHLDKESFREALYYTEKAISIAVGNSDFKMSKVELLFRLNRHQEAVQYYQLSKKDVSGSGNAEGFYVLALCHYYQDNVESSLASCQQSLRLEPDMAKCRKLYKTLKSLQEAREDGRKKFAERSLAKESYDLFVKCLQILKELQILLTSKNVLIESKVLCNLSKLSKKLSNWEEAVQHATEAITVNPNHTKTFAVRGNLYKEKEMFEESIKDYEAYLKSDPRNEDVKRDLQKMKVALAQSKKKDYYKILGVSRTASDDELKRAYKKLAMTHHPDRHSNSTPLVQKQQEKLFQELGQAYAILSDPAKRRKYDMGVYDENSPGDSFSNAAGFGGFDPNIFFSAFMNAQQPGGFGQQAGAGEYHQYRTGPTSYHTQGAGAGKRRYHYQ